MIISKKLEERHQVIADFIGSVVMFLVALMILIYLSGCFLNPIKSYESKANGDTRIDFNTGLDFGFNANAIDHVENNRGIKPRE